MHGFLFGGPTVEIQKNWRPIETAQRFSITHPKSLQPTLAVIYDRSLTILVFEIKEEKNAQKI